MRIRDSSRSGGRPGSGSTRILRASAARSWRGAKSTSSSRRSTSTRRSAITVEEYLERESAQEFWPLGPEPVVNLLQKSLGLKAKLAGFGSGDATRNVIHRSVPALGSVGSNRPRSPNDPRPALQVERRSGDGGRRRGFAQRGRG